MLLTKNENKFISILHKTSLIHIHLVPTNTRFQSRVYFLNYVNTKYLRKQIILWNIKGRFFYLKNRTMYIY